MAQAVASARTERGRAPDLDQEAWAGRERAPRAWDPRAETDVARDPGALAPGAQGWARAAQAWGQGQAPSVVDPGRAPWVAALTVAGQVPGARVEMDPAAWVDPLGAARAQGEGTDPGQGASGRGAAWTVVPVPEAPVEVPAAEAEGSLVGRYPGSRSR